jgi:hypothetical protein
MGPELTADTQAQVVAALKAALAASRPRSLAASGV